MLRNGILRLIVSIDVLHHEKHATGRCSNPFLWTGSLKDECNCLILVNFEAV